MIESLNIKNPIIKKMAFLGLSFADKVRLFYGEGLVEKT